MKIFCNQPDLLPKELVELLKLNDFILEEFNPLLFDLEEYINTKVLESNEIHVFLCYINYVQFSDLNQFPFLLKAHNLNDQIKFISVFNDTHDFLAENLSFKNITDYHYLSDPHFALIQKIKLQKTNWENHKVWGAKVLILDHDVSSHKLLYQILSANSILSICCSNIYEAKKYLNKQVKLIILSEHFALNKNWSEYLQEIEYKRSKICIINHGSKELISEIKNNGYHLIFERPLKLENFIQVLLKNIRTTTTSIFKRNELDVNTIFWPIKEIWKESDDKNIRTLKVAEDYFYQNESLPTISEKFQLLSKDQNIDFEKLNKILANSGKKDITITNDQSESATHIRIKKDENFFKYASLKLSWLLDDLFVNITQMQCFPSTYPDQWFTFFQKDLRNSILSPTVLTQFLTFEIYGKREYIHQCLNASIICSQILMRAIPNEYNEWPDKMAEEWEYKQKNHYTLMKLALSIRYDLFQKLTGVYSQKLEAQLDLNKVEADILLNFHWVSPYEESIELTPLARILKITHRYTCLSTGIHSKIYSEEPLPSQEACFKMLFEETPIQFRPEELMDFLYLMKMWNLWHYYDHIRLIKKYPCILAKEIQISYKPIKIECLNHLRAPEFQHLDFCKGCHTPSTNTDLNRKVYYCRSGNERLALLSKKIFGPDSDLEGVYDEEVNKSKRSHLL